MAKRAWIENGNIFITEDDTLVLQNYIEVPDWVTPQDLKIVNGQLVLKSQKERLEEIKQEKLLQLKNYVYSLLSQTDWVVIKCLELGLNIQEVYPEVKAERDAIRAWNEMEENKILQEDSISNLKELDLTSDFVFYVEKKKENLK